MDEIVKEFLIESRENLDRLDVELVKLESDPSSKELLASIFRTMHTIKGSCGFLGFPRLEKVAHAGENLLSRLRDGNLRLTEPITSALLAMVDAVHQMLGAIESSGEDGREDYAALIGRLTDLQQPSPEPGSAPPLETRTVDAAPANPPEASIPLGGDQQSSSDGGRPEEPLPDPFKIGGVLFERGHVRSQDLGLALRQQETGRKKIGEILVEQGAAYPEDVLAAQRTLESRHQEAGVETVRIGVNLLDCLMNLVGELVLARNQLLQINHRLPDPRFQAVCQRTNLITTELQQQVMKTRMLPIENIWNKFPRTVRDLALNCGKEVRLETEGRDTELDRTIIEAIRDPLMHLVRNAIDHGIELPEARRQAGKSAAGVLKLRAFHQGGQVNIEVTDDGAGLNRERIRQTALERGLLTRQQAASMADRDLFSLIFLPGFTTAEKVTQVSGRGVGMDVVKTRIEKIGGTVDLWSAEGKGTAVKIKIPLTLAIIPALMVQSGGERFAIPQASLLELVRLEDSGGVEMVHGVAVYRLRGRLLPLVYLNRELDLDGHPTDDAVKSALDIVVLQEDGHEFGLVVDTILDSEEIVVKPLAKPLKGINAYSGATILGDGRVALILDVLGLAQRAQVISEPRENTSKEGLREPEAAACREALLVIECGDHGRMAIPLSRVSRLEEFPITAVERAGTHEVVQYRGHIMPLVRLGGAISETQHACVTAPGALLQVVVAGDAARSVGLVVDRIVDIVEEHPPLEIPYRRHGVLGSTVIQKRVTEMLDVTALLQEVTRGLSEPPPPT